MIKLIIFEGTDRTGKSTAIQNTVEQFKDAGKNVIEIRYEDRWPGSMISSKFNKENDRIYCAKTIEYNLMQLYGVMLAADQNNTVVIADRFHLSELVYGFVSRNDIYTAYFGSDEKAIDFMQQSERWLSEHFDVQLIVSAGSDKFEFKDDNEHIGYEQSADLLRAVNRRYVEVFTKSIIDEKCLLYVDSPSQLSRFVKDIVSI